MEENKDWHKFEIFVKSLHLKKAKTTRLLKKNFDENSAKEFRERNINDTAYMAVYIKDFIENNLELKHTGKKKVTTINGTLTNMLRHNWAVGNKSRDNHLHHAVDALIIAFATSSEVQRLSTLSAKKNGFNFTKSEEKAGKLNFIAPMEKFRDEVQKSIDEIFVSFAPRRSVGGEAHDSMPYSKDKNKNILRKRNKVEIKKGLEINGGLVLEGETKRVDIFKYTDDNQIIKYFPIPIRVADFNSDKLPNITNSGKKLLLDDDSYVFLFSIYKNDFIEIKTKSTPKKESKILRGYFLEPAEDSLIIMTHNNIEDIGFKWSEKKKKYICKVGIQNVIYIKKYQVDPLGNKSEIKKEPRIGTKKQNHKKSK